jgi:nuclear control of ATPase protein 2
VLLSTCLSSQSKQIPSFISIKTSDLYSSQVLRIDSHFDRAAVSRFSSVPLESQAGGVSTAEATEVPSAAHHGLKEALPRLLELQRYVKNLSTTSSPNRPVTSASSIIQTLKDAHLSSSCETCAGHGDEADIHLIEEDVAPSYEHQLEELLLCKATTQAYGAVLNTILEQTLALNEHIWYWDDVLGSHRQAGLYSLQTSPLRLWSWSRSVLQGIRSRKSGLSDGWKQFYGLIKDVVRERSIVDLQARVVSPLAQVRNEATRKQKELKRLRDVNSNALGVLLGEGLSTIEEWAYHFGASMHSSSTLATSRKESNIARNITLLEAVLTNAEDPAADVETFEGSVSASTKRDTWSSAASDRYSGNIRPSDVSDRLIKLLSVGLPSYKTSFNQYLTTNGKPSLLIRYWLPTSILILSSGTIIRVLFNRKAEVLTWIREFGVTVRDFWFNWIVDPLHRVLGTIRHDQDSEIAIMSKGSLQGDRDSLERMVVDFAVAENGSLSEPELQDIRLKIREGDLTPVLKAYEKDMQRPVLGAIRGKLITALLIQIQKTKVDVEVAMGGIDSLLKSQELVFG